jgi:phospholipid/cholesterol/gamma-HCH transport system ATP-binding protein
MSLDGRENGDIAVRFDQVSKSVGATCILESVSFEIPRGVAFSILGRRGTGKTIALKLAIGLLKPDKGKIFVNGEEITALDRSGLLRVRRSTGFVFQNSAIFDSISVAENIAFPLRYNGGKPEGEIQEIVRQHLLQVGLEKDGERMPSDISVGMRKLLGFARALASDPVILLLDDPWNGVDSITAVMIRELLLDLKRRRTTILIVDNKMTEVRHTSDQFAILDGGHVIACGSPNEVAHSGNPIVRRFVSGENY